MTTDTALAKISLDEQMEAARAIGGERGEAILSTLQSIKDAGDDVVERPKYDSYEDSEQGDIAS
jgi:spore cortex formation protein SpoVR/YcgB (stage V sporulation)